MSKDRPRRLGRGLESLISIDRPPAEPRATESVAPDRRGVYLVPIERIRTNPYQPRRNFDEPALAALADSIRKSGLLQPLVVRPRGDGYELVAGERRLRAARLAGCQTVSVIVRETEDAQMLPLALVENLLREDLDPIERAEAYRRCCTEFQLTISDLAERIGEDRSTVSNFMRLLELPAPIRGMVSTRRLSAGHARSLLSIEDAARVQELAERAASEEWSVRQLEDAARRAKDVAVASGSAPTVETRGPALRRPQIVDLEGRLSQSVGVRVRIKEGRRPNAGKLVLEYASLDDFDRIIAKLGVQLDE